MDKLTDEMKEQIKAYLLRNMEIYVQATTSYGQLHITISLQLEGEQINSSNVWVDIGE